MKSFHVQTSFLVANMTFIKRWITATRLPTTSLALASVGLGSALAVFVGDFHWRVGILAALTASLLQVICNVANDYGDFVRGTDTVNPVKPPSAIQMQLVSLTQVHRVLCWLIVAAIGHGLLLLHVAKLPLIAWGIFVCLGGFAIAAALMYTLGNQPYGYQGWGDIAVLLFFGLLGVGGTFYLHTKQWHPIWIFPSISYGSLVVGVLNVNNLRDCATDALVGKQTVPVRIGSKAARYYHGVLVIASTIAIGVFLVDYVHTLWPYTCLSVAPWLINHVLAVGHQAPKRLTAQLQRLVLLTLMFVMCLSVGLVMEYALSPRT